MKTRWLLVLSLLAACGGGGSSSSPDLAKPTSSGPGPDDLASAGDLAGSTADLSSAPTDDLAMCSSPGGTTCPPTSGNCQGIGKPCTKGGGQCMAEGNSCDLDLDPGGAGACVSYGKCAPGMHQCGTGATCCKTSSTFFISVCIANSCLPSDCMPE